MIPGRHALGELSQLRLLEDRRQLRLTDQDHLEQLLPGGLEVRQEPDLLEHLGGEILRLVDDEDRAAAGGVRLQEVTMEAIDEPLGLVVLAG